MEYMIGCILSWGEGIGMWNGVFFFLWLVMLIVINEEKKGFSI